MWVLSKIDNQIFEHYPNVSNKETKKQTKRTMALAITLKELDTMMSPINSRLQQIVALEEKKKRHSDATKKGQEAWLIYRDLWLIILEDFPETYPTYNAKISHIGGIWRACKKSLADQGKTPQESMSKWSRKLLQMQDKKKIKCPRQPTKKYN